MLDLPTQEHGMELADEENPLGFVKDEAVGLVGEVEKNVKKPAEQVSVSAELTEPVERAKIVFPAQRPPTTARHRRRRRRRRQQ